MKTRRKMQWAFCLISLIKKIYKHLEKEINYFFLNPAGHLGFVPESFLINLPLAQVMVIFFAVAAAGLAAATSLSSLTSGAGLSFLTSAVPVLGVAAEEVWFNLMRSVGDEKVKFSAFKKTHLPI